MELDELIGPANYIATLDAAGQEAYPELIALGTPYIVSNTPEGDYVLTP